jgi:hypothetical protein
MTALTNNLMPPATLWVLTINTIALIGFAGGPVAQEYPLAVVGILAFLFVQAFLPACRIHVAAPLCPANIAQGYYWIQLVLVTVLVGYFGFSNGTLPYLPSKNALNLAIVLHVVGYLSFSVAYQCFGRAIVGRTHRHESTPSAAYLIVPFAVLGLLGFLLMHGGVAGFIEYASSPIASRLRSEEASTLQGAAGNFLKHFLGFAVVLAWSWWLGRAPRRKVSIIAVTAAVVIVLLIATFNYNRGSMLGPIIGLAAAFSAHVWRISFKGVILAGVLALSVAFTFGWYRSTDLGITELSGSAVADTWNTEDVVTFVQIYASGPQMSAYLIESLKGKFYYGKTLLCSLVYPIPVLGKPYRDISGPVIFNELIYGDTNRSRFNLSAASSDQIIPLDGELYINFHLAGVVLGNVLLGCFLAWLQGRFVAGPTPVESYAWLMMALWTVFPGSLSVTSQIYVYSFWPIYSYFMAKRLWSWNSVTASHRDQTAVSIRERRVA